MIEDLCKKEYLEISTRIGCPIFCEKYCPQEILVKNYTNSQKSMALSDFSTIIDKLPPDINIIFSGFCEPFANPSTIKMIEYAAAQDREIGIFTTLYGLREADVPTLCSNEYFVFCIHLPDGENTCFPITQEYKDNFFQVITQIPNVEFSIMNDTFKTLNRENVIRGLSTERKYFHICYKWKIPQPVVVPNGDVYLCGCDFGLWHPLGNLLQENYTDILKTYSPPYKLCYSCKYNEPIIKYLFLQAFANL